MVAFPLAPAGVAHDAVIVGPGLVHLFDLLFDLPVAQLLAHAGPLAAAGDLGGQVGVDEQLEGMQVVQHGVGAAAHDDAVPVFGQPPHHLVLHHEQLAHVVVHHGHVGKGVGKGETEIVQQSLVQGVFHVVLIHGAFFRHFGDDLPVVVGHAQLVGQAFAHLPAAAAEFTAQGDDPHKSPSLPGLSVQLILL